MGEGRHRAGGEPGVDSPVDPARPTEPQRRYLARGLSEPGGKLPLFDRDGRPVPRKTVEACLARGWAEPWCANPIKADWLVRKLTSAGYRALGVEPGTDAGATAPQLR
jgi:hypothetical protein